MKTRSRSVLAAFLAVALLSLAGCKADMPGFDDVEFEFLESKSEHVAAEEAPERIELELRNADTIFLGWKPGGRTKMVRHFGQLPVWQRRAAGIHVEGETPKAGGAEMLYVADLLGAEVGDTVVARLRTRHHFERAGRAAVLGGGTGLKWVQQLEREAESIGEARVEEGATELKLETIGDGEIKVTRLGSRDHKRWGFIQVDKGKEGGETAAGGGKDGSGDEDWFDWGSDDSSSKSDESDEGGGESASSKYKSVTIFGADWCPPCKRAKQWLDERDIPYTYENVSQSKGAKREMLRFCRRQGVEPEGIPTIKIGEEAVMQGWNPRRFQTLALKKR